MRGFKSDGRRQRKTPFKREPNAELEDLRDDSIALFLNSGMNFQAVHANGGPTPQTVSKWLHKETMFPRADTIRAICRAVGGDLVIVGAKTAGQIAGRSQVTRLNIPLPTPPKMDMIAHRNKQRASKHRGHRKAYVKARG
jgi:hypothetical protein